MRHIPEFVRIAEQLKPALLEARVNPTQLVTVEEDSRGLQGWRVKDYSGMEGFAAKTWGPGDSFILDFGNHCVGYLTLSVLSAGSPPDAPLKLRLTFGEMPCEVAEPFEQYSGILSRSWLQEELIHLDVIPEVIRLPRRYAFRYIKFEVLATSPKYMVSFDACYCTTVSSGNPSNIAALPESVPDTFRTIDRISIKTLQDCMHTVFEDGPKRDRRLWLGDLRLQALANYETFQNYELVKRCLYLFAGLRMPDGRVGANLFEKPFPVVDDIYLMDYALFFVDVLHDYVVASGDRKALEDLYLVAMEQIDHAAQWLDERSLIKDSKEWYCFVDWQDQLNKQASAQGIWVYALSYARKLAEMMADTERLQQLDKLIQSSKEAARHYLWDEQEQVFISGEDRQHSIASQVWMVLAGVVEGEQAAELLKRMLDQPPQIGIATPYMYHHFIEALVTVGLHDQAKEQLLCYWGGMVDAGADTFWEVYLPNQPRFSPYGSHMIHSYCHAWSCTPTYFIRKYWV